MKTEADQSRYLTRYRSTWPAPYKSTDEPRTVTTIALDCGHTATYDEPAPTPGTTAFCRSCDRFTHATKEPTDA